MDDFDPWLDEGHEVEIALWRRAYDFIRARRLGRPDFVDLEVLALRDLLTEAWEGGAKRTMAQARAADEAMVECVRVRVPKIILEEEPPPERFIGIDWGKTEKLSWVLCEKRAGKVVVLDSGTTDKRDLVIPLPREER